MLDVDTVVVGGSLAELLPRVSSELTAELATRVLAYPWAPVAVEAAQVREFPSLQGAALAPVLAALNDPEQVLAL